MPKIFAEKHDEYLMLSLTKNNAVISNKKKFFNGLHSSGYIFPFCIYIKVKIKYFDNF